MIITKIETKYSYRDRLYDFIHHTDHGGQTNIDIHMSGFGNHKERILRPPFTCWEVILASSPKQSEEGRLFVCGTVTIHYTYIIKAASVWLVFHVSFRETCFVINNYILYNNK